MGNVLYILLETYTGACNINSIITMYGNKVTLVHGCHGNFIFYYWLHFDYHRETLAMLTNFVYTKWALYLNRHGNTFLKGCTAVRFVQAGKSR